MNDALSCKATEVPDNYPACLIGMEFPNPKNGEMIKVTNAEGVVEIVPGVIGPRSIEIQTQLATGRRLDDG
jgi:hypothetical protein